MKPLYAALTALALIFSVNATTAAHADSVDRLSVGIGYFDIFDDDDAVDFRVEYRPGTSLFWELKPWIGAEVTGDGAVFGGAGFLYDFHMGNQWVLTPSIGAGFYSDGDGRDMDTIQFRSQIEMGYQFDNTSRLSAALGTFSGGAEVLGLYYHMPMDWIVQGPGRGR